MTSKRTSINGNLGMTLLEVMVAMAIFAIAGITLMKTMSEQVVALATLEENTFASMAAGNQVDSALAVKSAYFLATLQATTDGYSTRLVSLFERQSNNQATVIRRHFGGLE